MNFHFQNINWTKKIAILILGVCLSSVLLKYLVQPYRGTWIYQYGSFTSLIMFYGGILWSLINTIILILNHRTDLKNNIIWILISILPFLYILIMMTYNLIQS